MKSTVLCGLNFKRERVGLQVRRFRHGLVDDRLDALLNSALDPLLQLLLESLVEHGVQALLDVFATDHVEHAIRELRRQTLVLRRTKIVQSRECEL